MAEDTAQLAQAAWGQQAPAPVAGTGQEDWAHLGLAAGWTPAEWRDESRSVEERQRDIARFHVRHGRTLEQAQEQTRQLMPGADQAELARQYHETLGQYRGLAQATERYRDWSESPLRFINRRAFPFLSAIGTAAETSEYAGARQRFEQGKPEQGDYEIIARYERQAQNEQSRGLIGQAASGLAHIPALVGEAAVGGAAARGLGLAAQASSRTGAAAYWLGRTATQTAVMPSMWLPEAAQRAEQNGGEWYNPRNLAPAAALGAMNTAVLGSLGAIGNNVPGASLGAVLRRNATRVGTGMLEQQAVDVLAGVSGLQTGYGLMGDLLQGRGGEALQHGLVQAITFAAFAGMHEMQHPAGSPGGPSRTGAEILHDVHQWLDRMAARREAREDVGRALQDSVGQGIRQLGERTQQPFFMREGPGPGLEHPVVEGTEGGPGTTVYGPPRPVEPHPLDQLAPQAERPQALLAELRGSPAYEEAKRQVPAGSVPIGEANQAFVFRTPEGEVVRIAKKGERPNLPEMLQATHTADLSGDWQAERLPYVDKVGDRDVYSRAYQSLTRSLREQGYHPADVHPGNVGLHEGRPVLIDPGAAVKMPPEVAARYKKEAPQHERSLSQAHANAQQRLAADLQSAGARQPASVQGDVAGDLARFPEFAADQLTHTGIPRDEVIAHAQGLSEAVRAAAEQPPQVPPASAGQRAAGGHELVQAEHLMARGQSLKRAFDTEAHQEGVEPQDLHSMARQMTEHDRESVREHNEVLQEARRRLKEFGGAAKLIHLERYEDSTKVPGLDEVAGDLAHRYPHAFSDPWESPMEALFRMLKAGNQEPMKQAQVYREALNHLVELRRASEPTPQEVADVNRELAAAGEQPATAGDLRQAQSQALRQAVEHQTEDFFQPRTEQSTLFQEGGTGRPGHLGPLVPDAPSAPLYRPNEPGPAGPGPAAGARGPAAAPGAGEAGPVPGTLRGLVSGESGTAFIPTLETIQDWLQTLREKWRGGRPAEFPQALAHAESARLRAIREEEPIRLQAEQPDQAIRAAGMARLQADPQAGAKLVADLGQNIRPVSTVENFLLEQRRVALSSERQNLEDQLQEAARRGLNAAPLVSRLQDLAEQISQTDEVIHHSGSELGRSLRYRRLLMNDDFSFAGLLRRAQAARGGSPVPIEERGLFRELAERVQKSQKKLQEADEELRDLMRTPEEKQRIRTAEAALNEATSRLNQLGEDATLEQRLARRQEVDEAQKELRRALRAADQGEQAEAQPTAPGARPRKPKEPRLRPPTWDEVLNKRLGLQAEAAAAQQEAERAIQHQRWQTLTQGQRALDLLRRLRIMEVISSPLTAAKIAASSAAQLTVYPGREAIGSVLRMLPGIGRVMERAPVEGGGFRGATEAAALGAGLGKQGWKDARDTLRTGSSELDLLYGKEQGRPYTWIDWFGGLHAAEKAPAVRGAFERARLQMEAHEQSQGIDVNTPEAQDRIRARAYQEGRRAKFQQDNALVDAFNRGVRELQKPERSAAARGLGHAADLLLPIRRTPTNIVADTLEHLFGLPVGVLRTSAAWQRGWKNLPPEQADSIARQLKRGTLGLPLAILGYYAGTALLGGLYSGKRKEEELKPGQMRLGDVVLPAWATAHHPALIALQFGAAIRRYEQPRARTPGQGQVAATAHGLGQLLEEVPFIREPQEIERLVTSGFSQRQVGNLARSFAVPALFQWLARETDVNAQGETVRRGPQDVWQNIQTGIPGLRQGVPQQTGRRR